jgi:hypothetical protein
MCLMVSLKELQLLNIPHIIRHMVRRTQRLTGHDDVPRWIDHMF